MDTETGQEQVALDLTFKNRSTVNHEVLTEKRSEARMKKHSEEKIILNEVVADVKVNSCQISLMRIKATKSQIRKIGEIDRGIQSEI